MITGATQVQLRRGIATDFITFTPASGEVTVDLTNKRIVIGDGNTIGGYTGCNLSDLTTAITNLSGYVDNNQIAVITSGNLNTTGHNLYNYIIGGDTNLSGNLLTTGNNLYNYLIGGDTNLSGIISNTGHNLYVLVTNFSGQANTNYATVSNLALTGQQSWITSNNNGINISGNLTQTGVSLRNLILGGDTNLSGNLLSTGQALYNYIVAVSGLDTNSNIVYTTGNQNISGVKTFFNSIQLRPTTNLLDSNSTIILDTNSRLLRDSNGLGALDWYDASTRILFDSSESISCNWETRLCLNSGGKINIDWQNTILSGNWNIDSGNFKNSINISPKSNNVSSLTLLDKPFYINTYTGLVTWTLPTISSSTGRLYFIKNIGNVITLTGQGSDKIYSTQSVLNYTIYSGESWQVANDGNYWQIL